MCCISVSIGRFRDSSILKQCCLCQGFGQVSEICRFTTKCVKCAKVHLSKEFPDREKKRGGRLLANAPTILAPFLQLIEVTLTPVSPKFKRNISLSQQHKKEKPKTDSLVMAEIPKN